MLPNVVGDFNPSEREKNWYKRLKLFFPGTVLSNVIRNLSITGNFQSCFKRCFQLHQCSQIPTSSSGMTSMWSLCQGIRGRARIPSMQWKVSQSNWVRRTSTTSAIIFLILGKLGLWIFGGNSTSTIEYPRFNTVVVMKMSMPYFSTLGDHACAKKASAARRLKTKSPPIAWRMS